MKQQKYMITINLQTSGKKYTYKSFIVFLLKNTNNSYLISDALSIFFKKKWVSFVNL